MLFETGKNGAKKAATSQQYFISVLLVKHRGTQFTIFDRPSA